MLIIQNRGGFRVRRIIYFALLVIVLPASVFNYDQNDLVLKPSIQAVINLVLIFVAATTAMMVNRLSPSADDGRVLKAMSFGLLVFSGVLVPLIFTVIWGLNRVGFISLAQSRDLSVPVITGFSAVVSAVFTWLNYQKDTKKSSADVATIED